MPEGEVLTDCYYVYLYLTPDRVPFYIGKGKGHRYYVSNHLHKTNPNRLLKNKIRKVGVANVRVQFLHENLTEEEAFCWERYWIKYIGRRNLGKGTLVNMTVGGDGISGHIHSDDTKRKISDANKGRIFSGAHKQKISEARKGMKFSDGHKRKISNAKKGVPMSNEHKQKISKTMKGKKDGR